MANKQKIIMIGPSIESRGGIASVVKGYQLSGLFEKYPIVYLSTHVEGKKFSKIKTAFLAGLKFISCLLKTEVLLLHAHVARWNSFWRKSVFMSVAIIFRCPVILHLHSGGFQDFYENDCNAFSRGLIRFFLNRSAQIIVLTKETSDWLNLLTDPQKILILPNFIQPNKEINLNIKRQKGLLLYLGRFTEEKGIMDLLEATSILLPMYKNLNLVLAGTGDSGQVYQKINDLGLSHCIKCPGWISGKEKRLLLNQAQIFILPSYKEGLPISILEAMQNGCPIVATRVGGIPDQIQDGVQGLLVTPGAVAELVKAIDTLLSDINVCKQMGQAGKNTILSEFSDTVVLPQLEALYLKLGA